MTFKFDFAVDAWLNEVEIDAEDLDTAIEELHKMSLAELVQEGNVKAFTLKTIDHEVTRRCVEVSVNGIEYDIDPDEVDDITEGEMPTNVDELEVCYWPLGGTTYEDAINDEDELKSEIKDELTSTLNLPYGVSIQDFEYSITREIE